MAKPDVTGEVVEAIEDLGVEEASQQIIDTTYELGRGAGRQLVFFTAGATISGFVAGYFLSKKRFQLKYEKLAREEIELMREHYRKREATKDDPKPSLGDVVKAHGYASTEVPDSDSPLVATDEVPTNIREAAEAEAEIQNVFEEHVWDLEKEMTTRTHTSPYVIHKDEFDQGNFGDGEQHEQAQLTYFQEDDVLANAADQIVDKVDETIGLENLDRFGHGSGDPNVVFIRNHRLEVDFEVCRSLGSYASEVHGVPEEDPEDALRHSATRRGHRNDDDD